ENNRMISHVDRVLELAKLDGNNLTYDFELKDICELTNQELEQMKLQIEAKEGEMDLSSCAECLVHVDSFHFSNVIRNLIDNAIKYSHGAPQIQVSCIVHSSSFELVVKDEGIGMSVQEVKHAFDQFYRGGKLDRSGEGGFGLGLSYVRAVITAHEGKVKIASELGKGTTVRISIPKRNG
ncbi:MAG: sensor histidine kinase, partial [Flavobacteriales bacterium]